MKRKMMGKVILIVSTVGSLLIAFSNLLRVAEDLCDAMQSLKEGSEA